jgi:hypothetical protein
VERRNHIRQGAKAERLVDRVPKILELIQRRKYSIETNLARCRNF